MNEHEIAVAVLRKVMIVELDRVAELRKVEEPTERIANRGVGPFYERAVQNLKDLRAERTKREANAMSLQRSINELRKLQGHPGPTEEQQARAREQRIEALTEAERAEQ